jgi:hypothetical protein
MIKNGVATPARGTGSPKSKGKARFVNAVKATINQTDMVQKRVENQKAKRRTSAAHIDLVNHFKIRRYSAMLTPEVVGMLSEATHEENVSRCLFNPDSYYIRFWEVFTLGLVLAQAVYIPLILAFDRDAVRRNQGNGGE